MNEFKEFLIKLFAQMSTGDFTVMVECANNEKYEADVIGYSEEFMTIKVRFHSDNLTKPGYITQRRSGWGFDEDDAYESVYADIPVKEENVWYKAIILKNK